LRYEGKKTQEYTLLKDAMKMSIRCPGLQPNTHTSHPTPTPHTQHPHLTSTTQHPTPTLNVVKTRRDSDEHEIYFRQQGLKRLSRPRHLVVGAPLQLPRHGDTRRIRHPDGREGLENARNALMALQTFSKVIALVYFLHKATM